MTSLHDGGEIKKVEMYGVLGYLYGEMGGQIYDKYAGHASERVVRPSSRVRIIDRG